MGAIFGKTDGSDIWSEIYLKKCNEMQVSQVSSYLYG